MSIEPATLERLALLMEEMGESLHALGKALRHGPESRWPIDSTNPTNREDLERELGHVLYAIHLVAEAGDVSLEMVYRSMEAKAGSVHRWLHHQDEALLRNLYGVIIGRGNFMEREAVPPNNPLPCTICGTPEATCAHIMSDAKALEIAVAFIEEIAGRRGHLLLPDNFRAEDVLKRLGR